MAKKMHNKIKYIIFNGTHDLYHFAFYEVLKMQNIYYDESFFENRFLNFLRKIHWSNKINSIINLPGKTLWIKLRLKKYQKLLNINKSDNIIFIILGCNYLMEKIGFSACVKHFFPNSKIVYFFCDLVSKDKNKQKFLKEYRETADLIYSFDIYEAEKYGLKFHNLVYSDLFSLFPKQLCEYDISFIGQAKDRLDDIINAYESLSKKGLRCYFYVTGVSKEKQLYNDKIIYGNPIDYVEYLKIISKSKCLLELLQQEGTGNTIRVNEAIAFNKLLISNNKNLIKNSLYNSAYMKVFEDLNIFDVDFIKKSSCISYKNKEKMLPSFFIKEVEDVLSAEKRR